MNVSIPTAEEIFKISFLTMRGWKMDIYGSKTWKKEGKLREAPDYYSEYDRERDEKLDEWGLEQAFSEEFYD